MTKAEIGKMVGEKLGCMVSDHGYWFNKETGSQIEDYLRNALTDAHFELHRVNRELEIINLTLRTLGDIRRAK